jgi:hypothetical protein
LRLLPPRCHRCRCESQHHAAINPALALLTLIPLPALTFFMLRYGKIVHHRFTAVQEAFSHLTERAQESFSGIRVIKSYGDERSEERYFADRADACVQENVRLAKASGLFDPLINALATASMAILIAAGGLRVIRGDITLGQFVAFTGYLNLLIWPMLAVGWVVNMLTRGTASLERLQKLLRTDAGINEGTIDRPDSPSIIEVKNLSFAYPGTSEEVLRHLLLPEMRRDSGHCRTHGSGEDDPRRAPHAFIRSAARDDFHGRRRSARFQGRRPALPLWIRPSGDLSLRPEPFGEHLLRLRRASVRRDGATRTAGEDPRGGERLPEGYETLVGSGVTLSGGRSSASRWARPGRPSENPGAG